MSSTDPPDKVNPRFVFKIHPTSTSGSLIVPEYTSSVYENAENFKMIFGNEGTEFKDQIIKLYIEQMRKQAQRDEETYLIQKKYGIAIFITAILLLLSGITFSIVQLCNALKYGNFSQLQTTLEIQKAGNLVLSTSLIGAFVLTVSLVFFVLFLQYVYKPNNKISSFFENIKNVKDIMMVKD